MASPDHNDDEQPSRLGYFAAIFVSALGHAAIFAFVFFIAPRFLHPAEAAAARIHGKDRGQHSGRRPGHASAADQSAPGGGIRRPHTSRRSRSVKTEPSKTELALNDTDKNALKINAKPTEAPTLTATATPSPTPTEAPSIEETPEPTAEPAHGLEPDLEATGEPTVEPTPEATPQPTRHRDAETDAREGKSQSAQVRIDDGEDCGDAERR